MRHGETVGGSGRWGEELGLPGDLADRCRSATQRDQRAALVCLFTAAAVAVGRYTAVGDPVGGYFFLPSRLRWSNWARDGVENHRRDLEVEIWIDDQRFGPDDELP